MKCKSCGHLQKELLNMDERVVSFFAGFLGGVVVTACVIANFLLIVGCK